MDLKQEFEDELFYNTITTSKIIKVLERKLLTNSLLDKDIRRCIDVAIILLKNYDDIQAITTIGDELIQLKIKKEKEQNEAYADLFKRILEIIADEDFKDSIYKPKTIEFEEV